MVSRPHTSAKLALLELSGSERSTGGCLSLLNVRDSAGSLNTALPESSYLRKVKSSSAKEKGQKEPSRSLKALVPKAGLYLWQFSGVKLNRSGKHVNQWYFPKLELQGDGSFWACLIVFWIVIWTALGKYFLNAFLNVTMLVYSQNYHFWVWVLISRKCINNLWTYSQK